ncbi:hypothetical protein Q8A73_007701 [Channa argus]|nr:hypothetical protein Q8A73_007701 [Channa argus]
MSDSDAFGCGADDSLRRRKGSTKGTRLGAFNSSITEELMQRYSSSRKRPPTGQARPSVNPARNERRSLPTEKVSLRLDSCMPAQCEGQGTARLAAGDVTPVQAMAAMHKIASTDHRPPPICCDARMEGVAGG